MMHNKPFSVIADSHDRERWINVRKDAGIGASEVAAVLGISPFASAYHLACVKMGKIQPDDLLENERVFWGMELEDSIISGYAKRTGRRTVQFGLTLQSTQYPWLIATPDALVADDVTDDAAQDLAGLIAGVRDGCEPDSLLDFTREGGWRPLQVKNIGLESAKHWEYGVPDYYMAQCRAEAIVFGSESCTGCALIAGQRLVWDDVERTATSDRQIINLTRSFWADVREGRLPVIDGSDSTKHAIASQWPHENDDEVVQLGIYFLDMADDLAQLKDKKKEAESRIAEIENRIKAEIKDAQRAVLPDGSGFSYKTQTRAATTTPASTFRVLRRQKKKAK